MKTSTIYLIPFLLGFITLALAGCEKYSFDPSTTEEPVIFFKADFNGVPFDLTIGDSLKFENQFVIDDSTMRYFVISMNDASGLGTIRIVFNNYTSPYGNYLVDMDSTIKPGSKDYTEFFTSPFNPLQTDRVTIEYHDKAGNIFSTLPVIPQNGFFSIDSVYHKTWEDGMRYKVFQSSFECKMYNISVADSIIVKNGSATFAFEY
ncbi:MAG: hypothetical protein K9I29_09340 [Bacteroidales bacterium]|nr:hypothetical protein [Bacteroidales bacterium]MCF8328481.1 hypothetical protein [Bacteroidales bacterium]